MATASPAKKSQTIAYILLLLLIVAGFVFRYAGIMKGLSYWNDEGHAAIYARGLAQTGTPVNSYGRSTGYYQILLYALTAASFRTFGINEFAGRFPSVLAGTALIAIIYFVSKRLAGERAALMSAFLMTFAQMQLAWSTQLRPYVWLEGATLGVVYFCYLFMVNRSRFLDRNILVAGAVTCLAALFHATGLMNLFIIGAAIVGKSIAEKRYKYLLYLIPIGLLLLAALFLIFRTVIDILLRFDNNPMHYRIFITQNYKWLVAGAVLGGIGLYRKNKTALYLLSASAVLIFLIAIFKINSQFVRYSLPAFPLLYILFSCGIVTAADLIRSRSRALPVWAATGTVAFLASAYMYKKGKIEVFPRYYYTINRDMRENPIVDYKEAFAGINKLIGERKDVIIVDSWNDRVPWYMPGQAFIFASREPKIRTDDQFGEKMIRTVDDFENERTRHAAGVVLVENWESQMIPGLQDHVRKTLRHEFDVQDLPYNKDDKWSISVYSWGL